MGGGGCRGRRGWGWGRGVEAGGVITTGGFGGGGRREEVPGPGGRGLGPGFPAGGPFQRGPLPPASDRYWV
jgi:hypothetical protein